VFRVTVSDDLGRLAGALADTLRARPPADPFAKETIVVQNRGMERWLSLRLAERLGIWTLGEFPFPKALLWRVAARLGLVPDPDPYDPGTLVWTLMDLLPEASGEPARYLRGDSDGRRLVHLARSVADRFDQYAVHRGDLLAAWEARRPAPRGLRLPADDAAWQADLWRRTVARLGPRHPARVMEDLVRALESAAPAAAAAPHRVSVFGLSALPPAYLAAFAALGRHADVTVYALNPCREMWFETGSPRAAERERIRERRHGLAPGSLHAGEAPSLLALDGAVGRDFLGALHEAAEWNAEELWTDGTPPSGRALHEVRRRIAAFEPEPAPGAPRAAAEDADDSIRVHVCHSPQREIEVLHDQLLDRLARTPGLTPRDIIVMAPDIETYAAAVEAVFGAGEPRIPFTVADRSPLRFGRVADAVRRLLRLPDGDFGAPDLLDLLGGPPVMRRFGLDETGVAAVRAWVGAAAIRRGRGDAGDDAPHTWRFGLDRLVLGDAVEGGPLDLFAGVLPVDAPDPEVLAALCGFHAAACECADALAGPHAPAEWARRLGAAAARLIDPAPEEHEELGGILRDVVDWAAAAGRAGFAGELPLPAARDALEDCLDRSSLASPFLGGGVTFCNLVPMRSIPFRVVCLLGMDDDAFPRQDAAPGFDLIRAAPRPGDRSRRLDDRYLFLECLFAARDALHVSHVGRDIRSDEPRPPSVCVCELLDAVDRIFEGPGGRPAREGLVVRHPLQPFSRAYFDGSDPRLFSYSARHALAMAARTGAAPAAGLPPPIGGPLPEPLRVVTLSELAKFMRDPAEGFATMRLGVRRMRADEEPGDAEPLLPCELEDRPWDRLLIGARLESGAAAPVAAGILRAAGALPHGAAAGPALRDFERDLRAFEARLEPWRRGAVVAPVEWTCRTAEVELRARLDDLREDGLLVWKKVGRHAAHLVDPWLRHLVLCATGAAAARTSVVFADETVVFGPVPDPEARMRDWLEAWAAGLRSVLTVWPAGAEAWVRGDRDERSAAKVRDAWANERGTGWFDRSSILPSLVPAEHDPATAGLREWAERLYGPLFAAIGEGTP